MKEKVVIYDVCVLPQPLQNGMDMGRKMTSPSRSSSQLPRPDSTYSRGRETCTCEFTLNVHAFACVYVSLYKTYTCTCMWQWARFNQSSLPPYLPPVSVGSTLSPSVSANHIISGPVTANPSGGGRRSRQQHNLLANAFEGAWKQGNLTAEVCIESERNPSN